MAGREREKYSRRCVKRGIVILIEALNIHTGGGLTLLNFLLKKMREKLSEKEFIALVNENAAEKIDSSNIIYISSSLIRKDCILSRYVKSYKPTVIFCFGNLPPNKSYPNIRVITFFQNAHLLGNMDHSRHSFVQKLRYKGLIRYIKLFKKNTNTIIFQSNYIRNNFVKQFNWEKSKTEVLPFYNEESLETLKRINSEQQSVKEKKSFIYVSNEAPHKNHATLFHAWELLLKEYNLTPILYLTISKKKLELIDQIRQLNKKGCNIINLGFLPHQQILLKTMQCEYVVYPSLSETIGLGLVEGVVAGAKVIASDLPYLHEIINPSATFNPKSAVELAEVISHTINNRTKDSQVILQNKISELISFLNS